MGNNNTNIKTIITVKDTDRVQQDVKVKQGTVKLKEATNSDRMTTDLIRGMIKMEVQENKGTMMRHNKTKVSGNLEPRTLNEHSTRTIIVVQMTCGTKTFLRRNSNLEE